ncbi:hypothetical protein Tco_0218974 [Tanacetum coccineum]
MGDENPIRTLGDYSKPSHEGYKNTIELPVGNNVNNPRDFAKPVKAISLPQDVPSTSDRCLIELENQVQLLMEAHLALTQPTQVNKITSSCEIRSGPHDTQYHMENPEQAFVEYASSRNNEVGSRKFTTNQGPRNFKETTDTWKDNPNFNWERTQTFTSPQNDLQLADIELHFIPTDLQLADIFTKPLVEPSFTRLVAELAEADTSMNSITFTFSHFDKPLSFDLVVFSTIIGLKRGGNFVSVPPKETMKAGLETLGLIDENDTSISSSDLVNSSALKIRYFLPKWRVLIQYIVKCLGRMHGSHDQLNVNQ